MPYKDKEVQRAAQHRYYTQSKEYRKQKTREYRSRNREYITSIRKNGQCKCGINDWRLLIFHHRDPKEKEIDLCSGDVYKWSKRRIDKEVAKCDIMCFHCHILLHWELDHRT